MTLHFPRFPLIWIFIIFMSGCTSKSLAPTKNVKNNKIMAQKPEISPNCTWQHLRKNFVVDNIPNHPIVAEHIKWITENPGFIREFATNATPYIYHILNKIEENEFPAEIALLPMIESNYNPFAHSSAGAAGIWQIMPGTATGFGIVQNWWYDGRKDIIDSTNGAFEYLRYLNKFFGGDWLLTLAAYNSGEGTIKRAMKQNIQAGKKADFWSLTLPGQTKHYVPRLLALAAIIKNPNKYKVKLPKFTKNMYFKTVKINTQIDFNTIANLVQLDIQEIHKLNPGHNHSIVSHDDHHKIILPINKIELFKQEINKLKPNSNLTNGHVVKVGDSLSKISQQYSIPIEMLKSINKLSNDTIKIGERIIVPSNKKNKLSSLKTASPSTNKTHKKIVYITKPKDSLHKISNKFNVSISAIEFWNKISHYKPLATGKKIIIWQKRNKFIHTVKKGEVLSKIALKYKISIEEIILHNKNLSANLISPGQEIAIPV